MSETDRQTDNQVRSAKWALTFYEKQYDLLEKFPEGVVRWGGQDEICPDTGRKHKQVFVQTKQMRFSQIRKLFPGVHIEIVKPENWFKVINYCKKKDTRDPDGKQFDETNPSKPMSMGDALTALAAYADANEDVNNIGKEEPLSVLRKKEYWVLVNKYLRDTDNANGISLFTNNQIINAWCETRSYWVLRSRSQDEEAKVEEVTNIVVSTEINSPDIV